MKTQILESHIFGAVPFLLVKASDEAEAEIFASENASDFDSYFEDMETNGAKPTSEEDVFRVNFCDKVDFVELNNEVGSGYGLYDDRD